MGKIQTMNLHLDLLAGGQERSVTKPPPLPTLINIEMELDEKGDGIFPS